VTDSFDYLTGTARIATAAPQDWATAEDIPFWERPNHPDWGLRLSRVLYHEAIHFWQLLASAYLGNLVADDWRRLLCFEETGELLPKSPRAFTYGCAGEHPFSPQELVECWARYWDVHTRSPAQIIADEDLTVEDPSALHSSGGYYTDVAFDFFMRNGPDATQYSGPYRWLLDQLDGASGYAALVFPIIAHAAFGSPRPVVVFCECVKRARNATFFKRTTRCINLDWLVYWGTVQDELVAPVLRSLQLPAFTSGFDVITRGSLATHPIFREYRAKWVINGFLQMYRPLPDPEIGFLQGEAEALVSVAQRDPWVVFGLPGQPFYRGALGRLVPPPTVRFANFTWHAQRPIMQVMRERELLSQAAQGAHEAGREHASKFVARTYAEAAADLERRVSRFRGAEKAVELGLPPDAFERS
jgi:hypothetical protein